MQGERSAKCETKFYDFVLPGAQPNSYFEVAEPLRYGAMIENEDAIHRYWLQGLAYRVGDSASVHLQGEIRACYKPLDAPKCIVALTFITFGNNFVTGLCSQNPTRVKLSGG